MVGASSGGLRQRAGWGGNVGLNANVTNDGWNKWKKPWDIFIPIVQTPTTQTSFANLEIF